MLYTYTCTLIIVVDHPVTFFPSHSFFPSPFRQPPTVNEDEGKPPSDCGDPIPDEAFLMVTQRQWEDDIIYDSVPATQPITAQGQSIQMYLIIVICTWWVWLQQFSAKLSKLWLSFSLCNYVTYRRIFWQSMEDLYCLCQNPIFVKNTKVIVHCFVKTDFEVGLKWNRIVLCWNVRLYVLKLHTKN